MKIGILGGTFNPIHKAHLNLAEQCRDQLSLDKVLLIPTYIPPHKRAPELAGADDRLEMCRLAARDIPGLEACDFEVRRGEVSFTLTTLLHLRHESPDASLFLLMGADMFLSIQDWHEPEAIFLLATLCACAREAGEFGRMEAHRLTLEEMGARCELLRVHPMPMSSTEIRRILKEEGSNPRDFLPEPVLAYIKEKKLYGAV